MKILAIGDLHFRPSLPYAEYLPDRREHEKDEVFEAIHEAAEGADRIVLVGDVLNLRHNNSTVIRELITFLEGFGRDKQVYILSGNHEVYEGTKTALDFLSGMKPNWMVMTPMYGPAGTAPYLIETEGKRLAFLPYMTNAALQAATNEDAMEEIMTSLKVLADHRPIDVLFHHHAVSGTKALGSMTDLFNEAVLPRERLEEICRLIVGGHIHQPSVTGNTIVTGSIFTQEMGEENKFVWMIEADGFNMPKHTPIPLPVRPIFKKENPTIKQLDLLQKSSIIKAILTKPGQNVEAIKEKLREFDAHILLEDYPSERTLLHLDSAQALDLTVPNLLDLYAEARNKDPEVLRRAYGMLD